MRTTMLILLLAVLFVGACAPAAAPASDEEFITCLEEKVNPEFDRQMEEMVALVIATEPLDDTEWIASQSVLWKQHIEATETALNSCPMPSHSRLKKTRTYLLGALKENRIAADYLATGWASLDADDVKVAIKHIERGIELTELAATELEAYENR